MDTSFIDGCLNVALSCSAPDSTTISCASSSWAEWREWSNCTDTCGSCGTMQRFRACNKARPDCICEGKRPKQLDLLQPSRVRFLPVALMLIGPLFHVRDV
ncbi:hypothetical protein NECAME_06426 [Necator americanus]|uniref:Thrombospondin type 1 domain protein n=1 Tax=Necator americanus TaxID=51031 RepID=W2TU79_NECAM|nr:hypothetical protein NECAME_06426 [Necator americanus]ETN85338.1 hypothetical protein NECAME_06426 [Necator americanus]